MDHFFKGDFVVMGNTDDDKDFKEQMAARYQERVSMGYTSAGTDDIGREEKSTAGDYISRGSPNNKSPTVNKASHQGSITAELLAQVYGHHGDMDHISNIAPAPSMESQSNSSTMMRELIQKFEKELPELEKKQAQRQQRKEGMKTSLLARRIAVDKQGSPNAMKRISSLQTSQQSNVSPEKLRKMEEDYYSCKESVVDRPTQDNASKRIGGMPYTEISSPCLSDYIPVNDSTSFTGSATIQNITTVSSMRDRTTPGSSGNGHSRPVTISTGKEEESNNIVGPKPPISPDKIPSFHRFTLKRKVSMGLECNDGFNDTHNKLYKQRMLQNGQLILPTNCSNKLKQESSVRRIKRANEGDKMATKAATSMERYLMFLKRSATPTNNLSNFHGGIDKEATEISTLTTEDNRTLAEVSQITSLQQTTGVNVVGNKGSEHKKSPRRPQVCTKKKYGMVSPEKLFKRPSSGSICSDSMRRKLVEITPKSKTKGVIGQRSPSQKRKSLAPNGKNSSSITLQSSGDTFKGMKRTPRRYGMKIATPNNRSLINKCPSSERKTNAKNLEHASSSTLSSFHKDCCSPEKIGEKRHEKVSKLLSRYEEAKNILQQHQSRRSCERDNLSFDGSRLDGIRDLLLTEDELADTNLVPVHLRKTHYLTPERSEESMQIKDNVLDLLSGLSSTDEEENGYMYIADRLKQIKSNRILRMLQSPDHSPLKRLSQADDSLSNTPGGKDITRRMGKRIISKPSPRMKMCGSRATSQAPTSGTNSVVNRSSVESFGKRNDSTARNRRQTLRRTATGRQGREVVRNSSMANPSSANSKDLAHMTVESSPYSLASQVSSRSNTAFTGGQPSITPKTLDKATCKPASLPPSPAPFNTSSSPCLKKKSTEEIKQTSANARRGFPVPSSPSPRQKDSSVDDQLANLLQRKWHSVSPASSISFSHQSPLVPNKDPQTVSQSEHKTTNNPQENQQQQSPPVQRASRAKSEPCDFVITPPPVADVDERSNHPDDAMEILCSAESASKKKKKAGKKEKEKDKEKTMKKNKKKDKRTTKGNEGNRCDSKKRSRSKGKGISPSRKGSSPTQSSPPSPPKKSSEQMLHSSLSPQRRKSGNKCPDWYRALKARSYRVTHKLCNDPTKRWPIRSRIPHLVDTYVRNRSEVMQLHRRILDDLTDKMHPCRIPVSEAFRKTLEDAACNEWVLHEWTSLEGSSKHEEVETRSLREHTSIPLQTKITPPTKRSRFSRAHALCLGASMCVIWIVHAGLNSYTLNNDMDDLYCGNVDDWQCMTRAVT